MPDLAELEIRVRTVELQQAEQNLARFTKAGQGAETATKGLGAGAARMAAEVEKSTQAMSRQQAVLEAARQATSQEIEFLKQKTVIQAQVAQGTLTAAAATQKMAEAEAFAKTGSRALAQELAATKAAYDKTAAAAHQTTESSNALAGAFRRQQEANKSAQQSGFQELSLLKQKIGIQEQATRGTISTATATRRMAEADIFAKTGSRDLAQQLAATRGEFDRNTTAMKKLEGDTHSVGGAFGSLKAQAIALAASFVSLGAIKAFVTIAEQVASLRVQILNLNTVGDQGALVFARLQESATRLGTPVETTVQVFTRLSAGVQALGASNADILKVVETLIKMGAVGKVSTENMNSALTQLGQIFTQGKFQGDELNIILAQAFPIIQGIADGLGMTVEQMLKLRLEGKLTVEDTFKGILKAADQYEAKFVRLPLTVQRATATAVNTIAAALDELNTKLGITENIAKGISAVTDRLSQVGNLDSQVKQIERLKILLKELQQDATSQAGGGLSGLFATFERGGPEQLQASIADVTKKIAALEAGLHTADAALAKVGTTVKAQFTPAQLEAAEAVRKQIERWKEHAATLNLSGKALADYHAAQTLATTNNKELAEQVRQSVLADEASKASKEAATKATQDRAKAERLAAAEIKKAAQVEKERVQDVIDANLLINNLTRDTEALRKKEAETNAVSLAQLNEEIQQLKEESQVIAAGLGPKAALLELEKKIAIARTDRATATDLAAAKEKGLNEINQQRIVTIGEEKKKIIEATAAQQAHSKALEDAILTTRDLEGLRHDLIENLFDKNSFKKSLDDIEDFGKDLGVRLIEGIAFGKEKLEDQVLIPNFSDIFGQNGVIGGIMKNSGTDLGSVFGKFFGQSASSAVNSSFSSQNGGGIFSNVQAGGSSTASVGKSGFDLGSIFGKFFGAGAQSGMFSNVQAGGSSTAASAGGSGGFMSMFSGIFGGTGGASSSGTAAGGAYGSAFGYAALAMLAVQAGKDFSKGKYGSGGGAIVGGAIGAYFSAGNPAITAAAAQIGKLIGSLFDPLFKHEPTKGTQIREATRKWLKEIGASFAKEIDAADYFFEETKKLADKMFGGDFLAASKQVLTDKAGPEIAKQLAALGTAITSHQAIKLGKSVEQTGTSFGNNLIANLGIDKIPEAIKEILAKSDISFEGLTKRLTELFDEEKVIDIKFYKETIQGAVGLFFGTLPEAINVSNLALQSFTDDGIFSLTTFQEKVKETTDKFGLIAQSFTDAVKNGKPGEEAAKLFGLQLKAGLEELAVDSFIQDFIDNKLFANIDLSDGLDSTEIALLTERTRLASIEVDKLRTSLGNIGNTAQGIVDQIRALNAQLEELAQKRIQVRIDVIQQLQQIGSLSTGESITLQMKEFAALVDRALDIVSDTRIGRSGDTALQHTPDADLQKMFDALGQMANLTVQQFQDFKQQREAALQAEISAITEASQARISAIQEALSAEINAINAALEVQVTAIQEAADKRIEEIREEYEAKREAVQKNIELLREEQDQVRETFELRREALEKELQTAQAFKQVADSLQQTINGLMSQNSPFSGPEELAFLKRQADDLRTQIQRAKPEDRPELFNQLSTLLQSQLTVGQGFMDPVAFTKLFESVILELESLRDRATEEGKKVEDIQKRIADNTTAMELALKAIDIKIAAQEKYLQQLSEDENNAIAAVQKQAAADIKAAQEAAAEKIAAAQAQAALDIAAEQKAAALLIEAAQQKAAADITAEQQRTEKRLIELAAARDAILQEQAARITEQRDILMEQLVTQFGREEAERLLKDPMLESARQLVDVNKTLVSIDTQLFAFLHAPNTESSAQTQAHAPAAFSSGRTAAPPPAASSSAGGQAAPVVIHLSQPVSVNWQSSGNSEEEARRVMRAMDQQAIDNVRRGPLGQEIMKKVREGMGH